MTLIDNTDGNLVDDDEDDVNDNDEASQGAITNRPPAQEKVICRTDRLKCSSAQA